MPLDGKVRWQKRFASPARRTKRGSQFLKTINSRKSITNAKTSTPWQGPLQRARHPCPARHAVRLCRCGLERDAFLYVTDFLELEDPEESDEVEKAAVSGGAQPPREIRHTSAPEAAAQPARGAGRGDRGPRNGQKQDQKQESRPARSTAARPQSYRRSHSRDRRRVLRISRNSVSSEQGDDAQEDSNAPGAKRWRGRRRVVRPWTRRLAEGQAPQEDSAQSYPPPRQTQSSLLRFRPPQPFPTRLPRDAPTPPPHPRPLCLL